MLTHYKSKFTYLSNIMFIFLIPKEVTKVTYSYSILRHSIYDRVIFHNYLCPQYLYFQQDTTFSMPAETDKLFKLKRRCTY